jgi:hypothetical protein
LIQIYVFSLDCDEVVIGVKLKHLWDCRDLAFVLACFLKSKKPSHLLSYALEGGRKEMKKHRL